MEIWVNINILIINALESYSDGKLRQETPSLCPPKAEATGSNPVGCANKIK
jgi:hypothetical protein